MDNSEIFFLSFILREFGELYLYAYSIWLEGTSV